MPLRPKEKSFKSPAMKYAPHLWSLLAGSSMVAALAGSAPAQSFYFDANLGPALADDVSIRQFVVRTPGAEAELDPGVRLSVAGGYNINQFLGVQLETGFIHNEIDRMGGRGVDASLGHVPMLADVVLRYDDAGCPWVPYAGAGLGGDVSVISLDDVRAPNGTVVDGDGSTVVFAWQLFAGVRYKFRENMSIGGAYRFYSADGASWEVRRSVGDIESGTARVHSFGVDFSLQF